MATLAELTKMRAGLFAARMNGARAFHDANGERVEFKSDNEMAKALAALDAEIAAASGAAKPRVLTFTTSKGT
ncbi:phage head-tail joining protein [Seohaeicola nanhaiensis]|uniref:Phage head-tail joining protein n=1 Tax=Seohaeicola nanhaiensis TaxID=1387282 RepID=A0ABV9KAX8_9RHOB